MLRRALRSGSVDIQMPEMDGRQAALGIRAHEAEELTGGACRSWPLLPYALKEDRDACLAAGMDDYLVKPVSREQLWAVLSRWLREALPSDPDGVVPRVAGATALRPWCGSCHGCGSADVPAGRQWQPRLSARRSACRSLSGLNTNLVAFRRWGRGRRCRSGAGAGPQVSPAAWPSVQGVACQPGAQPG